MKRVVSAFLLVVVILGLLPIQASAAEDIPEPALLEEIDGYYISDSFALPNTHSHISNTGLADAGDDWSPMFRVVTYSVYGCINQALIRCTLDGKREKDYLLIRSMVTPLDGAGNI